MKHDRAARTRTVRGNGNDPPWKKVKWRTTRDQHAGEVIDDTEIVHHDGASDLPWIYEFQDGKGIRDITTEFWYEPLEPKIRDIKNEEWKRIMGDLVDHVPEQILFTKDGDVISNFERCDYADDLTEIFSPPSPGQREPEDHHRGSGPGPEDRLGLRKEGGPHVGAL